VNLQLLSGGFIIMKYKLNWCLKQKKGMQIVEKNKDIGDSYLKISEEDLDLANNTKGRWKTISSYYACYNAFYAILMKCGIKCEIHDCTLKLLELFDFKKEEIDFIKKLKEERIQVQYYISNPKEIESKKIKEFILKCRVIFDKITNNDIEKIRKEVNDAK
jgi:uncharacterized protein (UPF0332 family)